MTRERRGNQQSEDRPSDPPAGSSNPKRAPMAPGDEAPAGTPGTGEAVCRRCGGKGRIKGEPCPECEGTGSVIAGIGGA
jgi:hypothetical protein